MKTEEKETHLIAEGEKQILSRDYAGAKKSFSEALKIRESAIALHGLGRVSRAANNHEEALGYFEAAINADPAYARAYASGAEIFIESRQFLQALDCYACAINHDPGNMSYKDGFVYVAQSHFFINPAPEIVEIFLGCIETPGTDIMFLGKCWASILMSASECAPLAEIMPAGNYGDFCAVLDKAPGKKGVSSRMFLSGLKRLRVPDMQFEKFLVHLRRALFENFFGERKDFDADEIRDIAASLAHYCFLTDYVFPASAEESKKIAALREAIAAGESGAAGIAVLGCYEALSGLPGAKDLAKRAESGHFRSLLKLQIADIFRQKEVEKTIPALTPINDKISLKVRSAYETLPYPRWESFAKTLYDEAIEGHLRGAKAQVLNAGCGTGHEAIELATALPDAKVLAIDLSRASMAYGVLKAEELGLKNIEFAQADILGLATLDRRFDFICSSGVLHHMDDPFAGWRVLTGLLKPGGLMRIALYSKAGRGPVLTARRLITEKAYGGGPEGIRRFRYDCKDLLPAKMYENLATSWEFYGLSEVADLLFHVHEHQLTLPQIKDWMEKLGLEFLSFQGAKDVLGRHKKYFPSDPGGLNLDHWARFEEDHPYSFSGMYRFWCRRK